MGRWKTFQPLLNRKTNRIHPQTISKRLVEPFVGSGTVFLNIDAEEYLLCDLNEDLINLYNVLKEKGDIFIKDCYTYFDPKYNDGDSFYALREEFNHEENIYKRSMLFVYLNRYAFNGLCRYNSSGGFNTPYGKYKNPYFPGKEMLFFHEKAQRCTFICQDFDKTIKSCIEVDVIYNDPPYVPLSKTSAFVNYNLDGFTDEQHRKLANLAEKNKSLFLISNHDTEFTRKLYCKADNIITKQINRSISGKAEGRKQVTEILVTYNKRKGEINYE
jgi:DNA adenine methylase